MSIKKLLLAVVMLGISFISSSKAEDFGVGVIGLSVPHYMGADENYKLVFPIPLFSSMFDQKNKDSILILEFASDLRLPLRSQNINDKPR
tara:strand:+ start:339 stop:608 length:270 start_codon:yes stop_codon:yes gene_type:complete